MIARVCKINFNSLGYSTTRQPPHKIKYYNPKIVKKQTIKKDFGLILDNELKGLSVDILL